MAKTDHGINEYGVDTTKLDIGNWVELSWTDADNEVALIVDIETRSPTYKGFRSMSVLSRDRKGVWYRNRADCDQVTRVIPQVLDYPKL